MSTEYDGPRLTAYALGELVDDELSAKLEHDSDLRAAVTSIRDVAALLEEAYRRQPRLALDDEGREAVLKGAVRPDTEGSGPDHVQQANAEELQFTRIPHRRLMRTTTVLWNNYGKFLTN